jgi:ABC-2 type transport system permease protein
MMDSFRAVFRKEWLHIRRDKRVLFMTVMLPVMQMTMYGFIDQTVHDLPTVIVDEDHSTYSRELVDQLRATKTFRIDRLANSTREARNEVVAGRASVAIVIPPDYHDKRGRNLGAEILVLIDGSDSIASSGALAAVSGLTATLSLSAATTDARTGATVSAHPIILFNPEGRTANFIIPGLIAVLLLMVATMLASVSIVREREEGTMEQLLVTPVNPLGLMLGKVAPYLFVGIADGAFSLALMRFAFGVPIQGSLVFLFSVMLIYLASLLALGLFISTKAKTQQEAQQQAQMLFLPSIFLSGYLFPLNGMPLILQAIGQLMPTTHMVAIMRGIVLRDAGIEQMAVHVAALVAFGIVMVWLSVRSVSKITA